LRPQFPIPENLRFIEPPPGLSKEDAEKAVCAEYIRRCWDFIVSSGMRSIYLPELQKYGIDIEELEPNEQKLEKSS
jgi:hypothetical protein